MRIRKGKILALGMLAMLPAVSHKAYAAPLDAEAILNEYIRSLSGYEEGITSAPYGREAYVNVQCITLYRGEAGGNEELDIPMGDTVEVLRIYEDGGAVIRYGESKGTCDAWELDSEPIIEEVTEYMYVNENTDIFCWPDQAADVDGFLLSGELVTKTGGLPNGWARIENPATGEPGYVPGDALYASKEVSEIYWEGALLEEYTDYGQEGCA